jgi:uncharacterized RDD family membrane protein YckC
VAYRLADPRPREALRVKQAHPPVAWVVRAERGDAGRRAGTSERCPEPLGVEPAEHRSVGHAALGILLRLATGTFDEEGQGPDLLVGLAAVPLAPLYFALFHAGARGQTLGKRIAGIAVKDERTLGRLSLGRSLGRAYLMALLWWAFYIGGILDALWPLWDSKNQSLHDKAVGSICRERGSLMPTALDNGQRSTRKLLGTARAGPSTALRR